MPALQFLSAVMNVFYMTMCGFISEIWNLSSSRDHTAQYWALVLHYKINVQQIIDLISFDMNNAWFRLGSSLIGKQNEGLSIGGFLSSMLAFMLAIWNYAEHSTITSSLYGTKFFKNDIQILDGLRATDDGLIFVVVDRRWTNCFKLAFNLLLFFKNMGGKVTLEFDNIASKYIYLENININFNAYSDIFVSFHNKNFDHIIWCAIHHKRCA